MARHRATLYSFTIATAAALVLGYIAQTAFGQSPPEDGVQPARFEADATGAQPSSAVRQVSAQEPSSKSEAGAGDASTTKPGDAAIARTTDAERISRLERATDDGEKRLAQLKASLSDPQAEYAQAEAEFKRLDALLEETQKTLREATEEGTEAKVATAKQAVLDLEPQWTRAKERFEAELQERRMLKENVVIVEQKLQSDRDASDKLKGVGQEIGPGPNSAAATTNGSTSTPIGASSSVASSPPSAPSAEPQASGGTTSTPSAVSPSMPVPLPTAAPVEATKDASATPPAKPENPKTQKAPSKELVEAKQVAEKSAADADAAENEARSITERIAILQKSIKVERDLRDAVRKKVDIAEETLKSFDIELREKNNKKEDTKQLRRNASEAKLRLGEYREETRRVTTQLDKLQSELGTLQAEQLAAFEQVEQKRTIADEAQQKVEHLNNPFTARNLIQWSLDHGPRILSIFVAMAALLWVSRMMQSRLVRLMAEHGLRGKLEERENRARTLVSVFHNAANLLVIGGGTIMVLEEIGIPIGPLVGGAAVVGLAIAFGAQSLIKDYFTGFILLLEQQYLINDVIRIGEISGQVESISLRMTALRDLEGRVHFIPHGEIHSVTNLTHGWSRAVMEIGVAYKENVDHVIATLNELGRELQRDEQFGKLILEDLTMLGVDALGNSAVVIKLYLKTKPLQQWTIKREFLRRVKNRFDELRIEIPFPHRTVYHRHDVLADGHAAQANDGDVGDWSTREAA